MQLMVGLLLGAVIDRGELKAGLGGITQVEWLLETAARRQPSKGLEPRSLFGTGIIMRNTILSFGGAVVLFFSLAPCASSQSQQQDSNQTPAPPSGEMRKGPDGSTQGQQGRGRGLFGKISALQSDSIEVTRPDGTKISVKLTASTEFRKEREPAKLSDFKVGDNVIVRTNQAEADAPGATAVMVASVPAGFAVRGGPGGMPGTQGKNGKEDGV